MNYRTIIHLTGAVLMIAAAFILMAVGISAFYRGIDLVPLGFSFVLTLSAGSAMYFMARSKGTRQLMHRDVFLMVTLCWLLISFFGALPYLFAGSLDSITDAYFESVAGFTTTGATVVTDIEALPYGILFWRSLTQWIGGMGIIIFALAILPFIGTGGMQLFKAEAPEISMDKLRPRIIDTAKALWYIYALLTLLAFILLKIAGMSYFDAICHAFTALATGGFSTKNTSIAYYNSAYIDGILTVFMFLAGINYSLYFYSLRGGLSRFWESSEFKFYLGVTVFATILVAINEFHLYSGVAQAIRYSAFQVVSIMTTTGYATADYEQWPHFSQMLLSFLMFFGGMIGSTAGGMKQVRVMLMLKQGYRELYQLIHPRAVTTLKLDGKHVTKEILGSIWGFLFLFLFICAVSTLALTALGLDIVTASSTVVSAISNVGPALGDAGPAENYSSLPDAAKWVLVFCMLAGRLEIYTVIILLVPHFWKK